MPSAQQTTSYPTFKPESVPVSAEQEIARRTINSIRRYFAQPGIQERFEAWKKERGKTAEQEATK